MVIHIEKSSLQVPPETCIAQDVTAVQQVHAVTVLEAPLSRKIMRVKLQDLSREQIVQRVVKSVLLQAKLVVVNANAYLVTLAQSQQWIPEFYEKADIAFCDGAGVQLAAMLLTGRRIRRTTPPEWIGPALEKLGPQARLFWVGGKTEVVAKAARNFEALYHVTTTGIQDGFFDVSPESLDSIRLIERINDAAPNIILVNMGMPRQERWIRDNIHRLNDCVVITGGALVDHAAGHVRRPPIWVANMGLEWFVRLVREPRRLWRRYLLGLPVFGFHVLRHAFMVRREKRSAAAG